MKPKKIPKRYIIVYDAIFTRRIHVLLNYSQDDYAKWLKKNGTTDSQPVHEFAGFTANIINDHGPTEWVIYIRNFQWTLADQNTLIHEIVHTIIQIWQTNNIPFNGDTQEFLAQSIGNLYEDISAKLMRLTRR